MASQQLFTAPTSTGGEEQLLTGDVSAPRVPLEHVRQTPLI